MKRAVLLPGSIDACAAWRLFYPHLRMPNSKFLFNPGMRLPIEQIVNFDVAVVQRLATVENYAAIIKIHQAGVKVVYDLDDNLWNIPKYNPSYKLFVGARENFRTCMNASDAITVSTPALKAAVRKFLRKDIPITLIPNCVDFDMFKPLAPIGREKVVIGWSGSATHQADTEEVYSLLPDILAKNKNVHLEIAGTSIPPQLTGNEKVSMRFYVPIAEYPSRLASWRWDIMIAPLVNNLFNRSKSNIKILEAAALRVPILFSPVATYLDFASLNSKLDYLVCRTKQQWRDKITELANDPFLRGYYGELLYLTAKEHYSTLVAASKWEDLLETL